jgi:hypothetical protein
MAVLAPDPTQPLLPLFDPPVKADTWRPRGHLHLNRRVNRPTVSVAVLTWIQLHPLH